MSEWERIRRQCQSRRSLWEDPDFPAIQTSVFYHQNAPYTFEWRRPQDLVNNPTFIREEHTQFDLTPGKLGDKWLVSCLGCLQLAKGLFYRVVPADQAFNNKNGYCGAFRFRAWWCGEWKEVVVDDRLPTVNGKLMFLHSQSDTQYWPPLLEKAYAKLHGSYEALKYGSTLDGLSDLTGGISEIISLRADPTSCSRLLAKLLQVTSLVTAVVQAHQQKTSNSSSSSTSSAASSSSSSLSVGNTSHSDKLASGIVIGINYRIYAIEKVELYGGSEVTLVKIRSPLGSSVDYLGSWGSRDSADWDQVPPQEKDRLELKYLVDGEFWMSYGDLVRTFTQLEVVHLDSDTAKDEPSLRCHSPWTARVYQGNWLRGVTAGGCRNNTDTFHINPQLHLLLSDMEEVVISLNQHAVIEPKVIGFTGYPVPKGGVDCINRHYFRRNKSLVNSQYTNSRQVSERVSLEQGSYIICPTTFEAGEEATFSLRVYSAKAIKLKLVDTTPSLIKPAVTQSRSALESKSIQQYQAVFLQVADEHRTVNAFQLHELLDACLPNDYIKSCASLDICRQVILTMDTSGTGRLSFSQFKELLVSLKAWQAVFRSHTKERSGILKAERLRDALVDAGFALNTPVVSILVLRYMRKDGTLRFGDFVSAVLHLSVAFNLFDKKDPLENGTVKLTLGEWLLASMTC